jgi:hypothetical protein
MSDQAKPKAKLDKRMVAASNTLEMPAAATCWQTEGLMGFDTDAMMRSWIAASLLGPAMLLGLIVAILALLLRPVEALFGVLGGIAILLVCAALMVFPWQTGAPTWGFLVMAGVGLLSGAWPLVRALHHLYHAEATDGTNP